MNETTTTEFRNVAIIAAVLAIQPILIFSGSYYQGILTHMVIIALFAVALNIVFGHTDQLFLFTGGLAGLGAYGTAIFADIAGVSAWLTLPIAALICGLIGLAVSWVAAKRNLTVVLIAILTLAVQLVLSEAFIGARGITGGSTGFEYGYLGLSGVAEALNTETELVLYFLVLALLLVSLSVYIRLINSKYGLAWDAIREDEIAAESIGINVLYYKITAGFISAFLIGLVGVFYTAEAGYILPSHFALHTVDVIVLIVLIVGGLRTTIGPVIGAIAVVGIEQILATYAPNWQTAIFGGLLMFLFLYFRTGIVPSASRVIDRITGAE